MDVIILSEEYIAVMQRMLQQTMSEPIHLKDFLKDYRSTLKDTLNIFSLETIQASGPLNIEELEEKCSLDLLAQPNDARVYETVPGVQEYRRAAPKLQYPTQSDLKFVEKIGQHKDKSSSNPFQKTADSFNVLPLPKVSEDQKTLAPFLNELIVTVRFYRPARVIHTGKKLEKPHFSQEIECLGSNLLTELRDKIFCYCNKNHFFDISENPEAVLPEKTTDPGFFFIYDTFYNDMRNPNNPDYSKTVIDWAKTAVGLKNLTFQTKKMEETKFIDLAVSLGFPYLYLHHGNCEHVFTFSQIEVISPASVCHYIQQYPRIRSNYLFNNRKCTMCGVRQFVYVVQDYVRQIFNPTFACINCFYNYYYIDGKKVGDFKAYRICESVATKSDSEEELDIETETDTQEDTMEKMELDVLNKNQSPEQNKITKMECDSDTEKNKNTNVEIEIETETDPDAEEDQDKAVVVEAQARIEDESEAPSSSRKKTTKEKQATDPDGSS